VAVIAIGAWAGIAGPTSVARAAGGPVQVPRVTVGDSDGDGLPEASVAVVAGGPCACRCPVLGGAVVAGAVGEVARIDTRTALVICGTRVAAVVDPGPPERSRPPGAGAGLGLDPGGVGRGGPGG